MTMFAMLKVEFHFYVVYLILFGGYVAGSYLIGVRGRDFNLYSHIAAKSIPIKKLPTVDVYIPTCGEPIQVLKNTFQYAQKIKYEAKSIHVLDDGGRQEVSDAAKEFRFNYISRSNKGEGKKAGNLLHAYKLTYGEYILILDADFAPRGDILMEMVPYMAHDESIGIVQSPQFFDVEPVTNWLERGAAAIQILFYKLVQVSRQSFDAAICVGSCGLYRRSALEPTGFYQIGYSEDVHTGFMVMARGFRVHYIPIALAKGLCPDNLRGFFTQQIRWATGSFALCTNKMFWRSNITFMQRFCFVSGFCYYVVTGLSVLFIPVCPLLMVYFAPEYVFWWNMFYYLPSFLFTMVFLPFWMRVSPEYSLEIVQTRQISYYAHLFATVDKIVGNPMQWVPTGAVIKTDLRFKVFGILFFIISTGWYLGVLGGLYVNFASIGLAHAVPHAIFSSFYAYCNFEILRKYRQDNH